MPVKTIPDFLPMRRELYGNDDTFLAGISLQNLPDQAQMSAHSNDRGMEEARSAFQKLFLPFSYGVVDDSICRDALFRIRIGDKPPFSAEVDVNAGIIAVMNHLSQRYTESQRSGETVSVLHENSIITFTEPESAPPERPFWQRSLPYVKREQEQYRSLQQRNRSAESLCEKLSADLSHQFEITNALRTESEKIAAPSISKPMLLSDPVNVAQNFELLQGTLLAERLKPQLDYYADPQHTSAEKAWESVQDGFAVEEYLEASRIDPKTLSADVLDKICVHPHIHDPESAKRLMQVHIANAPRRLQMQTLKGKTVQRESISLNELSGKVESTVTASRSVNEKEKQKNTPTK